MGFYSLCFLSHGWAMAHDGLLIRVFVSLRFIVRKCVGDGILMRFMSLRFTVRKLGP